MTEVGWKRPKVWGPSRPEYRQESENRPRAGVTPEDSNGAGGYKPVDGNALELGPRYGATGKRGAEYMESERNTELGRASEPEARAECRYCRTELVKGPTDPLPFCPGCGMVAVDLEVVGAGVPRSERSKTFSEGGRGEEGGPVRLGASGAAEVAPMTPEEHAAYDRLMKHMRSVSDKVDKAVMKGLARAHKGQPGEKLALVGATYGALVFEAEVLKAYLLQDPSGGDPLQLEAGRAAVRMGDLLARAALDDDRNQAEREDQEGG